MFYAIIYVLMYIAGGVITTRAVAQSDSHFSTAEYIGCFLFWPIIWIVALAIYIMDLVD